ncbi:unnamed protein product [Peniophora sp. CBMAI 1063]|nr:unnamed protein product [Peniophora sp. CBMAI 1063]
MPPRGNGMTMKRIHREIADLKKEDLGNISLAPKSDDDPFVWTALIPGPEGSVYEGGVYEAEVTLPVDYPFTAPKVQFITRIYHMNINERGNICIDILKHNWSPALSVFKVILSLSSLLTDPNPNDPLVPSIASEYLKKRATHDETARKWVQLYALPQPKPVQPPAPPKPKAVAALNTARAVSSTPAPSSSRSSRPATPRASSSIPLTRSPARPRVQSRTGSAASTPIEIDDSDDDEVEVVVSEGASVGAGHKRRRSGDSADEPARKRGPGAGSAGGAGRLQGDVVVIDD